VTTERLLRTSLPSLRTVVEGLRAGECVACSIPLTGNPCSACGPTARCRCGGGGRNTSSTAPAPRSSAAGASIPTSTRRRACSNLDSYADTYAGERLRPRGSQIGLRRALARVFGADPALGAIVIVGRKR
jgi:hypothetical protein